MKLKTLRQSVLLLCILQSILIQQAKAIVATVLGDLPSSISEASGLDYNGSSGFWSHNDGNTNKLYRLGTTGGLKQTLSISGTSGGDWEDVTHNSARTYLYIGDFGNNNFDRRNLRIYRISNPSTTATTASASVINFSYPDQKRFPSSWKNFDAEAFFHRNGKLYVFTKGEGSAVGYTKLYTVPDAPGTYVATLVDSFYVNGRVTGAALSPDGKSAALITNSRIHLFRNFTGTNIFTGTYKKITIEGSWTQKEGVSFYSNTMIYIVDEGSPGSNHIYSINLSSYIPTARLAADEEEQSREEMSVYPNPASSFVNIEISEIHDRVELSIVNTSGQLVRLEVIENPAQKFLIDTEMLKPGIYFVNLVADDQRLSTRLSIVR